MRVISELCKTVHTQILGCQIWPQLLDKGSNFIDATVIWIWIFLVMTCPCHLAWMWWEKLSEARACMDFQSSFIRTIVDLVKHQKERKPEQKSTLSATSILTWISFPNMIGCVGLHYIFYILCIFSGIAVKSWVEISRNINSTVPNWKIVTKKQ